MALITYHSSMLCDFCKLQVNFLGNLTSLNLGFWWHWCQALQGLKGHLNKHQPSANPPPHFYHWPPKEESVIVCFVLLCVIVFCVLLCFVCYCALCVLCFCVIVLDDVADKGRKCYCVLLCSTMHRAACYCLCPGIPLFAQPPTDLWHLFFAAKSDFPENCLGLPWLGRVGWVVAGAIYPRRWAQWGN